MDQQPDYEYKGDWTEVSRKRSKDALQPPSTNKPHPLFIVAMDIVAQIHDYPTLTCLAMTCRTFHSLIYNSCTTRFIAFDNLERERLPKELLGRVLGWQACPRSPFAGRHPCGLTEMWQLFASHYCDRLQPRNEEDYENQTCNFDIFRYKVGQLFTQEWLPCYGCMRIRRRASHFFKDQTTDHLELLGCQALSRRCVDCNIKEDWRFDRHPPTRYLQDMPRGLSGFRLRCSNCRQVEWVSRRPRGKQLEKKLCHCCAANLKAELEPRRLFVEEWVWLTAIQVLDSSRSRDFKRQMEVEKVKVCEQPPALVRCQSQYHFGTLRQLECG